MPPQPITNDSPMPFGPHKGTVMKDVPAEHLVWLLNQTWIGSYKALHAYLKERKVELVKKVAATRNESESDEQSSPLDTYEDYVRNYRGF